MTEFVLTADYLVSVVGWLAASILGLTVALYAASAFAHLMSHRLPLMIFQRVLDKAVREVAKSIRHLGY
jgi:hypothetical protein